MKILLLAPHPFYQERGTPIAIDLLLKSLSDRGDTVDMLTYSEGIDRFYPNVRIIRTKTYVKIMNIRPGFSLKKIFCDFFMLIKMLRMMHHTKYDVVHAVEESSFFAWISAHIFKVPFIYDMDSLLSEQLVDRYHWLKCMQNIFHLFESVPIRKAISVVPMCKALDAKAKELGAQRTYVLHDVSLLDNANQVPSAEDIRTTLNISGPIVMYIGNLERYQGVHLLLEAFQASQFRDNNAHLVIIGGQIEHIGYLREWASKHGLDGYIHFLGKRPITELKALLAQADIVASPRTHGENTPMKIYSYLDSERPVIATNIVTHTQIMDDSMALLVEPNVEDFSRGLNRLYEDTVFRNQLAGKAKDVIHAKYTLTQFNEHVNSLYSEIEELLNESRK